jgi:hypothetical protein
MKKAILIVLFAAVAGVGSAFAQTTFEKSKKINKDEVPVAVMQAFQKEYGNLDDKGYWKVYYTEKQVSGKTVFTPERYQFNGKKDGEKVLLTYSANGNLENSKGANSGSK